MSEEEDDDDDDELWNKDSDEEEEEEEEEEGGGAEKGSVPVNRPSESASMKTRPSIRFAHALPQVN